jgi:hypothetical protein
MIASAKDYLDSIAAVPPENYRGVSTTDLLVYVVSQMQEHEINLTFELIVVAAHRFFPEAFSLVGFPEHADSSRVGRTLLQCRPKYRGLIKGSASSRFVITEVGRARAVEVGERIVSGHPTVKPARRGKPRAIVDRIEQEVKGSAAFTSWRDGQPISEYDFYHFLHLLPGSSRASARENFQAIIEVAKDSSEPSVRNFLAALKTQYAKELGHDLSQT